MMNAREYSTSFYAPRIKTVLGNEYDYQCEFGEMDVDDGWWERDNEEYDEMVDRLKCAWFSRRDLGQLVDRLL